MGAREARAQFSQEELRALPRICHAQKYIDSALESPIVPEAERKMWAERLGAPFESFHHFCWALIYMRRANDSDVTFRRGNFEAAVANFEYVQRYSNASFPLLPEVYLRKGMAYRYLGNEGAAASQFLSAIRLKDDYTPAYAALVDLYLDLKDTDAARAILEQRGLKHAPNSAILSKKKLEMESRALGAQR
jgi:tetratricopeptide (TPR) repeat protein